MTVSQYRLEKLVKRRFHLSDYCRGPDGWLIPVGMNSRAPWLACCPLVFVRPTGAGHGRLAGNRQTPAAGAEMILDTLSSTACASRACQVRPAYSGMSASGRKRTSRSAADFLSDNVGLWVSGAGMGFRRWPASTKTVCPRCPLGLAAVAGVPIERPARHHQT